MAELNSLSVELNGAGSAFWGDMMFIIGYSFRYTEDTMKRPTLTKDLVPVKEFRSNMATYLKQVSESGRPVVITQRGRAAAVLVEPSVLDEIEEAAEVVRSVMRGMDDAAAGNTISSQQLFAELEGIITAEEERSER